jgi:Peptidase family M28
MKCRALTILVLFISIQVFSQEDATMKKYASLVSPAELKDNLTIIASDALEGRFTGSRGQKMAAAFIANHFQEIGLEAPVNGSYYQPIALYSTTPGDSYLLAGQSRYENFGDMIYSGDSDSGGEVKAEVLFAGLGREEDLKQLTLTGKGALIMIDKLNFQAMRQMRSTAGRALDKGAKYIFVISNSTAEEFDQTSKRMKGFMGRGQLSLEKPGADQPFEGIFYLKTSVAEKMFNTTFAKLKSAAEASVSKNPLKKIKPGNVVFQTTAKTDLVRTENVLGYLPGTDKKDELVIVTAHYDHIGKRDSGEGDLISNGADDDGSGTVAVLQMAKAFSQAKKDGQGPRRSMLFMTVTGEEEGLLGSEYYVTNPVFPLANTVVDLNIDMIGRSDEKNKDNKNYVYVIGADKLSSELHELNERMNNTYTKLKFDYVYNDQNHPDRLYYRSDHWNFAKNNIPIIFYFDGIHEDYHKVSDEVSKIDFDQLALRAQNVFYTAWEIANREGRLKVDKK